MSTYLKLPIIILGILVVLMTAVIVVVGITRREGGGSVNENANANVENVNTTSTSTNQNFNSNTNTATNQNTNTQSVGIVVDEVKGVDLTNDARLLSQTFAERFGSYSNTTHAETIESLYSYMTEGFRKQQEREVRSLKKNSSTDVFGVTTRVITTQEDSKNDVYAKYTHGTRRTETRGTENRSYNQDIVIELQYISDGWRVNNAVWK